MKKTIAFFVASSLSLALVLTTSLSRPAIANDDEGGAKPLFNGKDLTGWKPFFGKSDVKPEEIWSVEDGVLHCSGKVNGYIITEKEYENYVLTLDWRWPEKPGNSGVFVHVMGEDKIWPKGLEAQLMANTAGDIFLVGNFGMEIDSEKQTRKGVRVPRLVNDVEKPAGEWNTYEIVCKGDTVKLSVNGKLVNQGTKTEASKGRILLQSEGAPIDFRKIEIKSLD